MRPLKMTALAIVLGLAWLSSGCAANRSAVSVRPAANLIFGPSIVGIRPTDTLRSPWPVATAPAGSAYSRVEIHDTQYGTNRPQNSYYRRFDSVRSSGGNR